MREPFESRQKLVTPYTGGPRQARPMPLTTNGEAEIPHFLDREPMQRASDELTAALADVDRLQAELAQLLDPTGGKRPAWLESAPIDAKKAALAAAAYHESNAETKEATLGIQAETGALRESIGTKIDTTLVPYELICAAAVGLNYGAIKYAARNFEKGLSERNLLMSIERHNRALMDGDVLDKDSGVPHACLLASSVAMYVATASRGDIIEDLPEPTLRKTGIDQVAKLFCIVEKDADARRNQGES